MPKKEMSVVLWVGGLVLALVVNCSGPVQPPGQPPESPQQGLACSGLSRSQGPLDQTVSLDFGGKKRSYELHLPTAYDATKLTPVVVNLHGLSGTAKDFNAQTGMLEKANSSGFVVVAPQALSISDGGATAWNAGTCCASSGNLGVDDVGFVRAVLESVSQLVCVDPDRIYLVGLSNGAMFANRLACDAEVGSRVAALAAVSGSLQDVASDPYASPKPASVFSCNPTHPISVLHVSGRAWNGGSADACVPFEGGVGSLGTTYLTPARHAAETWTARNGCSGIGSPTFPSGTKNGDLSCAAATSCPQGTEVKLCAIANGAHWWPRSPVPYPTALFFACGGSVSQHPLTDTIWDFFASHPRRSQ